MDRHAHEVQRRPQIVAVVCDLLALRGGRLAASLGRGKLVTAPEEVQLRLVLGQVQLFLGLGQAESGLLNFVQIQQQLDVLGPSLVVRLTVGALELLLDDAQHVGRVALDQQDVDANTLEPVGEGVRGHRRQGLVNGLQGRLVVGAALGRHRRQFDLRRQR